jgi:hypothetical protein
MPDLNDEHDDGLPWGWITPDGVWRELPKIPLLLGNFGPPPFTVTLPSGQPRHVIHAPVALQVEAPE